MSTDIAALVNDNLELWTSAIERKSGAGRGGSNKVSLYGIERLRALILDLAVRGKLVPQDTREESATQLFARIRSSKPEYLTKHDLPKQRSLTGPIEQVPFELPGGWIWTRLGDIAAYIQRGKSPKYSDGSGVYVVSQRCVQWTGLDLSVAKEISQASLDNYEPYRFLRPDDLLWNSTGTGTIGRVIALNEVPEGLVCDSHVTLVRCPWVNARYLQIWLASDAVYGQIEGLAAGSTNQIEWTAQLANRQLVPLPPLAEQHRIVAKVDELMALCDALEAQSASALKVQQTLVETLLATLVNSADATDLAANWARIASHFDTLFITEASIESLKRAILNLAVQGKLVEQDAADEAASELIERIAHSRASGSYKKRTTARSGNSSSFRTIPIGWEEVQVGDVFSIRTGFAFKSSTYSTEGTLVFRVTNFDRDGAFDLSDSVYFPSDQINEKLAGFLLEEEDIIMVMVGGTIGKTTIIDRTILPALLNQNMWRIRSFGKHMFSRYEYLLVKMLNSTIEGLTQSTHGHFAMGDFAKRTLMIPPLAEQHRIVAKVDELMALCDALKARLTDAAATQKHFADAIVERAVA